MKDAAAKAPAFAYESMYVCESECESVCVCNMQVQHHLRAAGAASLRRSRLLAFDHHGGTAWRESIGGGVGGLIAWAVS